MNGYGMQLTLVGKRLDKRMLIFMYELEKEVRNFIRYNLNDYHHEQWTTNSEGEDICNFILNLIDHVQNLERRLEELEGNLEDINEE